MVKIVVCEGGMQMATKSFLKNYNLHSKRECQAFIRALERSDEAPKKPVKDGQQIFARDMDKETIRKIFVTGEQE